MIVKDKYQVFNLYDTNGRRADVINAYNIYCNILEDVYKESDTGEWGAYPKELTQFNFYKSAIQQSPEIFKKHPKYDEFIEAMKEPSIRELFRTCYKGDIKNIKDNKEANKLLDNLDKNIEARARHYTSNLVKIGLADSNRRLTPIAKSWINGHKLFRSRFENILPIDDTNLIFLRQLLKLRVYDKEKQRYYSPMMMAMKILLTYEKVAKNDFISMVQMLGPYSVVNVSDFIDKYINGDKEKLHMDLIEFDFTEISKELVPMTDSIFKKYFKNAKSEKATDVYREFYDALINFNEIRSEQNLLEIVKIFSISNKKSMLNKAFGFGKNIFEFDNKDKTNVEKFLELNKENQILTNKNINKILAYKFKVSKQYDVIQEYGDVTYRVMNVTGIISFKNGIVELVNKDIWKILFEEINIDELIFVNTNSEIYENYENDKNSYFCSNVTIDKILGLEKIMDNKINKIKKIYLEKNEDDNDIKDILYNKTSNDFIKYIEENYPKEKILEILPLFSHRKNDDKIKKMFNSNTDVPTIFEFIIGIAWYHISSVKFDLFSSLNLSMNADFEPVTHAGGGVGDIIIDYGKEVIMIEVTMMNKQAQKRGEWEPVLRHATNLTVDSYPKDVTTIFIADELDENTINIWRAVASVPLKSSKSNKFARNVKIMPLSNKEIYEILNENKNYTKLLDSIKESFKNLPDDFDMKWRENILSNKVIS